MGSDDQEMDELLDTMFPVARRVEEPNHTRSTADDVLDAVGGGIRPEDRFKCGKCGSENTKMRGNGVSGQKYLFCVDCRHKEPRGIRLHFVKDADRQRAARPGPYYRSAPRLPPQKSTPRFRAKSKTYRPRDDDE